MSSRPTTGRWTISRESRKSGLTDRIEGSPFDVDDRVEVMRVSDHESIVDPLRKELARLGEDMTENCVSKAEATRRLNEAAEVARAAERLGIEAALRGDDVRRALISVLSVGSQEIDAVIEVLVAALRLAGATPEALQELKFGPRQYTPEQAEVIKRAVAERQARVEKKAAELCRSIDGDDWDDATEIEKSIYRRRALALVEPLPLPLSLSDEDQDQESEGERHDREVSEAEEMVDWRCECGDLNRGHEWCCFRCGAGKPESREDMEANIVLAHQRNPERLRAALDGG